MKYTQFSNYFNISLNIRKHPEGNPFQAQGSAAGDHVSTNRETLRAGDSGLRFLLVFRVELKEVFYIGSLEGFLVISFGTATGFTNNIDDNNWSPVAHMVIILLMLIGGCAGATDGRIKVLRVLPIQKYVSGNFL